MCGYVYVIHAVGTTNYKIGLTDTGVEKRLVSLQSASAYPLKIAACIKVKDSNRAESSLHSSLSHYRVNGEWFSISDHKAIVFKESLFPYRGCDLNSWFIHSLERYNLGQSWSMEIGDAKIQAEKKQKAVKSAASTRKSTRKLGRPPKKNKSVVYKLTLSLDPQEHAAIISLLESQADGKRSRMLIDALRPKAIQHMNEWFPQRVDRTSQ